MNTILEFTFETASTVTILMPENAEPLTLQMQCWKPTLWAYVDADARVVPRTFTIYGTGDPVGSRQDDYIGTYKEEVTGLVWHMFNGDGSDDDEESVVDHQVTLTPREAEEKILSLMQAGRRRLPPPGSHVRAALEILAERGGLCIREVWPHNVGPPELIRTLKGEFLSCGPATFEALLSWVETDRDGLRRLPDGTRRRITARRSSKPEVAP